MGHPAPPPPPHQIILKARKHQRDNRQAVGPHYTNPAHMGFLSSSHHSWQGCVNQRLEHPLFCLSPTNLFLPQLHPL